MARKKPLKPSYKKLNLSIGNWFKGGGFTISNPTSWHYNGSNYYLGFERYTEANPSQMWIIKQTDNNIEYNNVNTGTSNPDSLDHTTPLFGGVNGSGNIYVMQCDGWVEPIRVYKSTNPEDITAWTYVGNFDTDASYIFAIQNSDINDCWFTTRSGNAGNNGYDMSLLGVDLDDPTNYTKLRVTEGNFTTNQVRHYNHNSYFFGTSTYRCLFVNHRNESTSINYKVSIILWEYGTNNMHDFALTTSKDVNTSGGLTTAELEADYVLVGTDSSKGVNNVMRASVQISNDVYVITVEPAGSYLRKYTIGSLTPTATYTLPFWGNFYLYNTGSELLVLGYDTGSFIGVYKIEYDLTGWTYIRGLRDIPLDTDFGVPYNFGDVIGKYLILGGAVSGDDGNIPVEISKEQWI